MHTYVFINDKKLKWLYLLVSQNELNNLNNYLLIIN